MSNLSFLQKLKQLECPDATYEPEDNPLVFAEAQGSEVFDVEGRRYIDFCSGFGVMALGHNPKYVKSVTSEEKLLLHAMGDVYPSAPKVQLLEAILSELPPHLTHGAFSVTGSQAVESAMKTAMLATGRQGFIVLEGGYHGLDFGSLSVTSREDFRAPFKSWLNETKVEFVKPEATDDAIKKAFSVLKHNGVEVAAVLVEPIQGRAGVRPLSKRFLNDLRSISLQEGSLLIFDEIFCGYGRTGRFSFSDDCKCDITCLGKPMGGGLPLSGFFATETAMKSWRPSQGEAIHTGTFFGHALACRFGLEFLQQFKAQNLMQINKEREHIVRDYFADLPGIEVTGAGSMLSISFGVAGYGAKLMDLCRSNGLIVLASGAQGEGVSLTPAYNIPDALLREGLEILRVAAASL